MRITMFTAGLLLTAWTANSAHVRAQENDALLTSGLPETSGKPVPVQDGGQNTNPFTPLPDGAVAAPATGAPATGAPATAPSDTAARAQDHPVSAGRFVVQAEIAELQESTFKELQSVISLQADDNGALGKISGDDAKRLSDFLKAHQQKKEARILSRPMLVTIAGRTAKLQAGAAVSVGEFTESGTTGSQIKHVGIELDVTVQGTSDGGQLIELSLTNSAPLSTEAGQGFRRSSGFDGRVTTGRGDALFVAGRVSTDKQMPWLVATLRAERITNANGEELSSELRGNSLPAPYFLDDDVQYFPSGPEVRLDRQAESRPSIPGGATVRSSTASDGPAIETGNVVQVTKNAAKLEATEGDVWTLKYPQRVSKVFDFDSDIIAIDAAGDSPKQISLRALRDGVTTISVVCEDGSEAIMEVTVSPSDRGLRRYLQRLYPRHDFEVYPINGSVLLRGRVHDIGEARQVIAIAERFFPNVLNQLKTGKQASSGQSVLHGKNRVTEFESWASRLRKLRERQAMKSIRVSEGDSILFLTAGRHYSLQLPEEIVSCRGFDEKVIKVSANGDDPASLTVFARQGTAKLHLTGRSKTWVLEIVVEKDVTALSAIADKLYPRRNLLFMAVPGGVVLRGIVGNEKESSELVEIAQQYFPRILNQLIISAERESSAVLANPPATADPFDSHDGNSDDGSPAIQAIPAGFSSPRDSEIKAIRTEIRSLHDDVLGLIRILKDRQKDAPEQPQVQKNDPRSPAGLQLLCFYADYCTPCRKMDPILDRLAADFPDGAIQRIDITVKPELVREYRVAQIPSFVLVRDGQMVTREIGIQPEMRLRAMLAAQSEYGSPFSPEELSEVRPPANRDTAQHAVVHSLARIGLVAAQQEDASISIPGRYKGGLLLSTVHAGSAAHRAGLRDGDTLLGMAGYETLNLRSVDFILRHVLKEKPTMLSFLVLREDESMAGSIDISSINLSDLSSAPPLFLRPAGPVEAPEPSIYISPPVLR